MYLFTLSTPLDHGIKVYYNNHANLAKRYANVYNLYSVYYYGVNGLKYIGYFSNGKLVKA